MGLLGSIAGGLFGLGSSVMQNSQNRQNVRETNQMNYKINQMNNQFNERMAIQQRNWQENMWNKENAYNTASAQRQRLEEAGLNPYLMMNGGSAGVAQSAGTGTAASSSGNAVMQPFQADYSGIGSSIGNIFQYELMQSEKSQLQGARQLADAKAMEVLSNIDWGKLTDETRGFLKSTGLARAQLGYAKEQQEVDNMAMTGLVMRAQHSGMLLDNEAKNIMNKYLDQQQQLDLNVKAADYYQRMAAGYVSYAEAKKAIAEEALAAARTRGQNISNEVASRIADSQIAANIAANESSAAYHNEELRLGLPQDNARSKNIEEWYRSRNEKKRYKYFDADKWVEYGTSIGNTIGNFLPRRIKSFSRSINHNSNTGSNTNYNYNYRLDR
nr:MAG TPA: Putative minor capsid protein [Microviridae sp.]